MEGAADLRLQPGEELLDDRGYDAPGEPLAASRASEPERDALIAVFPDEETGGGAAVHAPGPRLATDNAAMIARAGLFRLGRGERSSADLNAYASQALPGLVPLGATTA